MRRVRCCRSRGRAILIDCNRRGRLWIHMHNSTAVSSKCEQCHVHSHVGSTSPWSGGQGGGAPWSWKHFGHWMSNGAGKFSTSSWKQHALLLSTGVKVGGRVHGAPNPVIIGPVPPPSGSAAYACLLLRSWSDADNESVLCGLVGLHVCPSVCLSVREPRTRSNFVQFLCMLYQLYSGSVVWAFTLII